MKKTLTFVLFFVMIAACSSLAMAQSVKIGVFNPQRVSEETNEGKRIQAELTNFQSTKQQELSGMEQELNELRNQLTTQALSLSADRKAQLEKEIQKKILDLNAAQEAARREMQLEINAAQGKFQEQLFAVVEQFGRDEGFALILDAGLVVWASEQIDVTTAIVDRFNTMVPAGGGEGQ